MLPSQMACFQRASPALMEILLNRLHNVDKSLEIDHHLYEFGSVQYHIQASMLDLQSCVLSISMPLFSPDISNDLPVGTLKAVKRIYADMVDIMQPPKEGFQLTLRIDFSKLPDHEEGRIKVIKEISSLQAVILSSQLREMLWSRGSQTLADGMHKPIKLVYHPREPFFVIRSPEKITTIFPMRFRDDSDVVLATAFFQELMDVRCSTAWAEAPPFTWSPIPPIELRGESFQDLSTNGGFASFDIFSRHVEGSKLDKTVWSLLNFYAYVKYHVKCSRGFMQRRIRKRLESLTEVLQEAKIKGEGDIKPVQGCRCMGTILNFSQPKIHCLRKKIKRIGQRIKIQGFNRFRRRWLKIPKFVSLRKYTKLD